MLYKIYRCHVSRLSSSFRQMDAIDIDDYQLSQAQRLYALRITMLLWAFDCFSDVIPFYDDVHHVELSWWLSLQLYRAMICRIERAYFSVISAWQNDVVELSRDIDAWFENGAAHLFLLSPKGDTTQHYIFNAAFNASSVKYTMGCRLFYIGFVKMRMLALPLSRVSKIFHFDGASAEISMRYADTSDDLFQSWK